MIINETPSEYRKSNRQLIEELIGKEYTDKLYEHFLSDYSVLSANESDYIIAGIPESKARILYIAKNIVPVKLENKIRCSNDAYAHFAYLGSYNVEHFVIMPMNRANEVIANPITVSSGGLTGTVVDTKVLFQKLLVHKKINGFICAHNHPSGNLSPSDADIELTKKLIDGAKLLDLKMFDHLIITQHGYYSFADNGHM